jgi:NADPH:quinone reductase-like Zn-dependent oxidoreductase
VIDYRVQDFARSGRHWDRILDMVATRGPAAIARALAPRGTYRALGGEVSVLLGLVFGGLRYRFGGKSIGILMVPTGRALTERVAQFAVEQKIRPHLEDVLPLASVPEALRRTGLGEVRGKLVIRP